MTAKTASKTARRPRNGQMIVEFVKRTVIGDAIVDPNGSSDIMAAFFDCVERDARDDMNSDHQTKSHYEMSDNLGVTKLTVVHEPHGVARTHDLDEDES